MDAIASSFDISSSELVERIGRKVIPLKFIPSNKKALTELIALYRQRLSGENLVASDSSQVSDRSLESV